MNQAALHNVEASAEYSSCVGTRFVEPGRVQINSHSWPAKTPFCGVSSIPIWAYYIGGQIYIAIKEQRFGQSCQEKLEAKDEWKAPYTSGQKQKGRDVTGDFPVMEEAHMAQCFPLGRFKHGTCFPN